MVPKNVIRRIMQKEAKKQGMKISKEALEKMKEIIEDIGVEIGTHAKKLAKHAKREIVDDSDIKLVIR